MPIGYHCTEYLIVLLLAALCEFAVTGACDGAGTEGRTKEPLVLFNEFGYEYNLQLYGKADADKLTKFPTPLSTLIICEEEQ